jgi:FkbM family methyltransferase
MASGPLQVVAFEPVPKTFDKLAQSVSRLGLERHVETVPAAVMQDERTVRIAYCELNSLFSQVTDKPNERVRDGAADVASISLDVFRSRNGVTPALIKIDVEGSEAAVLGGALEILSAPVPPALMMEVSPDMLAECDAGLDDLERLLTGYRFYYVDDIVGQRRPYGSILGSLKELRWTCNVFAIPALDGYPQRCADAFEESRRMLRNFA